MHHSTRKFHLGIATALALIAATLGHAQGRGGGAGRPSGVGGGAPSSFPAARPSTAPAPATHPATTPPAQAQHGADTAAAHGAASPAALQLAASMKDINQTSFDARMQLLKNADMSVKENRDALKKIQSDARDLRGEAREKFKAALDDVKAKDAELESSVAEARDTDAAGWQKAREKVAAAYQHHLEAQARLDAARKNGDNPPQG